MKKILESSGKNEIDCGSCETKGCNSCNSSIVKSDNSSHSLYTRRNFGRTVLAASAGAFLAGCSSPAKPVETAAAKADSAAAGLSPDLAVVKNSKGPIMTTLTEFYKMGPAHQVLIQWAL